MMDKHNFDTELMFRIISQDLNYEATRKLYKRINDRVDSMIKEGLEEEALKLKDFKELNPLNTVGYKEFFNYFEGKLTHAQTIEKIKQNTRNYAKRQITWLKKYSDAKKINMNGNTKVNINKIL